MPADRRPPHLTPHRSVAVAVAVAVAASAVGGTAGAAAPVGVAHEPPVDAPISTPFDPPQVRWGAGNRGVDFATEAGTAVRATAPGQVVFSGTVGGDRHVVVLHEDGLRTTYAFLGSTNVRRGDPVERGQVVGRTGSQPLHLGARAGDDYIDPLLLFAGSTLVEVALVPEALRRDAGEAAERRSLVDHLRSLPAAAARAGAAAIAWARRQAGAHVTEAVGGVSDRLTALAAVGHQARQLRMGGVRGDELVLAAAALARLRAGWERERERCTPPSAPPPRVEGRRILVEVAGLGSSSEGSALDGLDPASMGYARRDVMRFSYLGGTTADASYTGADTTTDVRTSAARLVDLLERIRAEHPGVPVDIVGHSQGGLVARAALADAWSATDPRLPPIGSVVTLGTPHGGADLATIAAGVGATELGRIAAAALHRSGATPFDPRGRSVWQMSETSGFMAELAAQELPPGVRFTSIAASGDVAVPSVRSHLPGGTNVVVDVGDGWPSLTDHDRLPGSAAGRREVALALAGAGPTCTAWSDVLEAAVKGKAISLAQDAVGAAAVMGALLADHKLSDLADRGRRIPVPGMPRPPSAAAAGRPRRARPRRCLAARPGRSGASRRRATAIALAAVLLAPACAPSPGPREAGAQPAAAPQRGVAASSSLPPAGAARGGIGIDPEEREALRERRATLGDAAADRLDIAWSWAPASGAPGQPAVDPDGVAVAVSRRSVVLLDPSGTLRWEASHVGVSAEPPLLLDDLVVVAADDGVLALDRRTGATRWHASGVPCTTTPVAAEAAPGDAVVACTWREGAASAVSLADGAHRWTAALPGVTWSPAAVAASAPAAVALTWEDRSSMSAGMLAIDAATGSVRWEVELPAGGVGGAAVAGDAGAEVVVAVAGDGAVHAHRLADGTETWVAPTAGGAGEGGVVPVVVPSQRSGAELLVVPDRLTNLVALAPASGAEAWRLDGWGGALLSGRPALAGTVLAMPRHDGVLALHRVPERGGADPPVEPTWLRLGAVVGVAAGRDGTVVASVGRAEPGRVVAFTPPSGG